MNRINRNISIIERCNLQYRNKAFSHLGLKGYQYSFMTRINRSPGISQETLTKEIHIDKSNVARSLNKLEQLGYIYRLPDPQDHRCFLIYPTTQGQELFPEIIDILKQQRQAMMSEFTEEEIQTLDLLLGRLRSKAEALVEMEVQDEPDSELS